MGGFDREMSFLCDMFLKFFSHSLSLSFSLSVSPRVLYFRCLIVQTMQMLNFCFVQTKWIFNQIEFDRIPLFVNHFCCCYYCYSLSPSL